MFPISIVLGLGVAIALERFIFLSMAKRTNKSAFTKIEPLLAASRFEQILQIGKNDLLPPISRMIAAGIARLSMSPRREDIEYAMEEGLMESIPRLERRTGVPRDLGKYCYIVRASGHNHWVNCGFLSGGECRSSRKSQLTLTEHFSGYEYYGVWLDICYPVIGLPLIITN